jgi:hypothetical protein
LVVGLGVGHILGARLRIESGDRRGALVLDQQAGGRAVHRRRGKCAHGDGDEHEQEDGDNDIPILVDGVDAVEQVGV